MIEEKLNEAGVKLRQAYRLVLLDVPGVELGDLTVDVTRGSRLFARGPYRNLTCAIGPCYREDTTPSKEAIEEQISDGAIQVGRVSLAAFDVDLKESTLRVGRLQSNRQVCVICLHCGRTYHKDERQIAAARYRFFCKTCLDAAVGEYKKNRGRRRRKPGRSEFRLDRGRNILRYEAPPLSPRMVKELLVAAATPPTDDSELILPRPFVMFEPGTSKIVWEPGEDDPIGKQLKERCARAPRRSGTGQQPVPLNMVIDAYAPKDWDPRPWIYKDPLKVPGIIGVQLVVDGRLAGWVSNKELKRSYSQTGWVRELPEYSVVAPDVRAREV
jgi:hypothetical protein